jgi:Cu2+-containing amine oxidase
MQPGGDRYVIDGTHVEYLGWTFHISHDIQTGIKMYDVRYRGERIAYEIGMSEAMATYSGISDVVQAGTIYGDTTWGLGSCPSILVKGIDCPAYARLLDITFLEQDGTATTKKDAMCIFEQTMQGPVRRHYDRNSGGFNFYGGTPNHALVIRAFYPVYNYDYMIDHVFYHNGAFEIRGATSGYLQSTFFSEALAKEAKRFGVKIQDNVMGTEHDHFLNFKVDFDLIDEKNDVMIDRVKVLKCEGDALADYGAGCKPQDIYGKKFASQLFKDADDYQTKSIEHEYLTTEQGLSLTPDVPTMIHIVNKESKNAWGVERGYKMKINGVAQNVLANTKMHKAYSFSKHTVMATRYHEEELHVTTTFDQQDTTGTLFNGKPLIDMDQYLNGEDIDNQDIVFWANVGVHHIPHSEDIPVTHMIGNAVQISFIPTNMYDMDQSMDLGNVVYMNVEEGKDSKINRYDLKDEPEDLCPLAPYLLGSNLVIESCEGYPAFGASE